MTQPEELIQLLGRVTLLLERQNERWEAVTNLIGEQNGYIAQLIESSNGLMETTRGLIEMTSGQSDRLKEMLEMNQRLIALLEKVAAKLE